MTDEWKEAYKQHLLFKKHTTPMPVCPACNSVQVQIMQYGNKSADWKCRHCQHKWNSCLPTGGKG